MTVDHSHDTYDRTLSVRHQTAGSEVVDDDDDDDDEAAAGAGVMLPLVVSHHASEGGDGAVNAGLVTSTYSDRHDGVVDDTPAMVVTVKQTSYDAPSVSGGTATAGKQ